MNLTEIKKSLEEISPWPWFFSYHKRKSGWWLVGKRRKKTGIHLDSDERCAQDSHKDMFFIASAPETISSLLYEIERLKLDEITRLCELETMALENERMKETLAKLKNCDWVISLPDRMDAVRKIAGDALESTK